MQKANSPQHLAFPHRTHRDHGEASDLRSDPSSASKAPRQVSFGYAKLPVYPGVFSGLDSVPCEGQAAGSRAQPQLRSCGAQRSLTCHHSSRKRGRSARQRLQEGSGTARTAGLTQIRTFPHKSATAALRYRNQIRARHGRRQRIARKPRRR